MTSEHSNHSEAWHIFRRLISFDTVSERSNAAASKYVAELLDDAGFTIHQVSDQIAGVEKVNVIGWAGPCIEGGLMISGHLDIVPFERQLNWQTDPLTLTMSGDRAYGRGTSDMKGFLAQTLAVTRELPLERLKRPLVFVFTCDEEVACQGSARLVPRLPDVFQGRPLPQVALIGEPTNFEIFPAHKGYATLEIEVSGKGGHSSLPAQGVNAITWMSEVIRIVRERNAVLESRVSFDNSHLFPGCGYASFNPAMVTGGLAPNMIPDSCRLALSLRVPPGDGCEDLPTPARAMTPC